MTEENTQTADVPSSTGDEQTEKIREIVIETARMQLATVNAGIAFWTGWIDGATKFSDEVGRELANITAKKSGSSDVVGSLLDSSRQFLREMAELPDRAAAQFEASLERSRASTGETAAKPTGRPKATRRANVKE